MSCYSLYFLLKSLLFDGVYKKINIHTYIIVIAVLDEKTWFKDNPMTSLIFEAF